MSDWPFEQGPNTKAITTVGVLEHDKPILSVVHYDGDNVWGFFCGTTESTEDGRVITMEEALKLDPSLAHVAKLPAGARAYRATQDGDWVMEQVETT